MTEAEVWEALAEVPDPEIPVISLVDLGVVREVEIADGRVRVAFTPTFLGCPAVDAMKLVTQSIRAFERDGQGRDRRRGRRAGRRLCADVVLLQGRDDSLRHQSVWDRR